VSPEGKGKGKLLSFGPKSRPVSNAYHAPAPAKLPQVLSSLPREALGRGGALTAERAFTAQVTPLGLKAIVF